MIWNCAQIEERLSDHLDGMLNAEESRAFGDHVAGCVICAPLVQRVTTMVGRMRTLEPVEAPARLIPRILEQTLGPRTKSKKGWLVWLSPLLQPRFAMGGASLVATLFILIQGFGIHPTKLRAADLNPENLYHAANRRAHLVYARGAKFVNDLRVVYEIQSRLRPEAAPLQAPQEEKAPPPPNPQQKSEGEPHPGRSANDSLTELASLLIPVPRSLQ
jgi:hypothetical protein